MKSLKHIWTVLCKKSVIDNETNNLSLYEVLERLQVKVNEQNIKGKVPTNIVIPFDFEIISFWVRKDPNEKERVEAETRVQLYDPNGNKISEIKHPFIVPADVRRMRVRLRSSNLSMTISGIYKFVVSAKETGGSEFGEVAEVPLEVEVGSEIKIEKKQAEN